MEMMYAERMRVASLMLVLPCLSVTCISELPPLPSLSTDSGSSATTEPSPTTSGPSPTTSGPVEDTGIDTGLGGCSNDADCDDDNPCSIDGCNAGTCEHQPNQDDPTCSCETPADCTQLPMDDDCRTRACTDGVCSLELADAGTELNDTQQTMEDCQLLVCDGSGGSVSISDDTDIPVDGLDCTADECVAGVPSNPPLPAGTGCAAGECNDSGQCVGCNGPGDCGGSTSFCQMVTCDSGVCGLVLTPEGTDVPGVQTSGDCQVVQCDGRGNEASVADDTDLPADDGIGCTDEVCTSGVASHPAAVGQACDDALFCTANDSCNAAADCVGVGDPCPGADGDSNCAETCNEASDACNAPDPNGSACDDGLFCNGADTCSGGACMHAGSPCPGPDGDVDCSESCNEAADACTANDPDGYECGSCGSCSSGNCGNQCDGFCCEPGICITPMQACP